jgi:dienelactone hydrolase
MYYNRIGRSFPIVKGFFEQIRNEEGSHLPIGAAGFCWGGKHAVLLAQGHEIDGKLLIDAGFTGHPSILSIPGDIEKMTLPVSFAIGDEDVQLPMAQVERIKAIVEAKPEGQKGEVKLYPKVGHGFCMRADLHFENVAEQAAKAEDHCIDWFNTRFNIAPRLTSE